MQLTNRTGHYHFSMQKLLRRRPVPFTGETKIYRRFTIVISLTIGLVLSGVFWGMAVRTRQLIIESSANEARALFESIVLARRWNADHGGVYVEKREGVISNSFLDNPDIVTTDGRVFTKRNPAMMTREISTYAERSGLFRLNITSLRTLNPDNRPDEFEKEALVRFEEGHKEEMRIVKTREGTMFRYMAPIFVEDDCLKCHAKQGYKAGDIRGGISVSFDIGPLYHKLRTNMIMIILSAVVTTLFLLSVIYIQASGLISRVLKERADIERYATTDSLTEISNRRHLIERFEEEFSRAVRQGADIGCIIFDIDHFKAVNDRFGHAAGDEVLKEVARRIKTSVRNYDMVGRWGGEEFIVIAPQTSLETTAGLAERIRNIVKAGPAADTDVTVSAGVAVRIEGDSSIDDIIKRADKGLYIAKNAGRDRVASAEI